MLSPGPDGLRPAIFKVLAHNPGGSPPDEAVMPALTEFINDSIDGNLPAERQRWRRRKPNRPPQDRNFTPPDRDGPPFPPFHWTPPHAARVQNPDLVQYLLPHQLAVGVSGGCEAVIHVVRELTTLLKEDDVVLIRLDASNAFNSMYRQCILYGEESVLFFGPHEILSRTGTQQDDPPGMLLFSLALHPLILRLQRQFRLPLTIGYADDLNLINNGTILYHEVKSRKSFVSCKFTVPPLGFPTLSKLISSGSHCQKSQTALARSPARGLFQFWELRSVIQMGAESFSRNDVNPSRAMTSIP